MANKDYIVLRADPDDDADFDVTAEALERGLKARSIRRARQAAGVNQAEFAARCRVPLDTLRDWEHARVTPPESAVARAKAIATDP